MTTLSITITPQLVKWAAAGVSSGSKPHDGTVAEVLRIIKDVKKQVWHDVCIIDVSEEML